MASDIIHKDMSFVILLCDYHSC